MEDFEEEYEESYEPENEGFCGAIRTVMNRPARKLFPTMDEILDE
jgi:hypothetical protein